MYAQNDRNDAHALGPTVGAGSVLPADGEIVEQALCFNADLRHFLERGSKVDVPEDGDRDTIGLQAPISTQQAWPLRRP